MHTKEIVFTAPHVAEFLDAECRPPKGNEIYNRLANEKNFPMGVLFDWQEV